MCSSWIGKLQWGGGDVVLDWLRDEPTLLPSIIVLTAPETSAHVLEPLASPVVKTMMKPFPMSALLDGVRYVGSLEPK